MVWKEITNEFPNFNGCAIEVCVSFIPRFILNVITYHRKETILLYSLIIAYKIWLPTYVCFNSPGSSNTGMRQETVQPLVK